MRVSHVYCKLIIPTYSPLCYFRKGHFYPGNYLDPGGKKQFKIRQRVLKRTISLRFLSFFSADKSAPRVKLETLGTSVKTILLLPVSRHSCVLFSLSLCRDSPHSSVVRPQLPIFVPQFAFSCPSLTQLLSAHQTEPTCPCFPWGPWYTWYSFLTSPRAEWQDALRLVTGFPFLFSCSSYLSVFLFSQENFPQDDITSEHLPQWPWPH